MLHFFYTIVVMIYKITLCVSLATNKKALAKSKGLR